jgi:alkylation response protein AidB-like acyl-CoA dehydrogenase
MIARRLTPRPNPLRVTGREGHDKIIQGIQAEGAGGRTMQRRIFDDSHDTFRNSFRRFVQHEIVPHHRAWEKAGRVDKRMFRVAGTHGFLGIGVDERYGGGGATDFRFNAIISEELQRAMVAGSGMCITLHNNVCLPYLISAASDAQRQRWLPSACTGESMLALAITEPGAGSDVASITTTAARHGRRYVVNGSKMFVSSGVNCDRLIVAAKTNPAVRAAGISLLVIDGDSPGLTRSEPLSKIGLLSQDTAELSFQDVEVPTENLLGEEGSGFDQLMQKLPQERLGIAVACVAGAEASFAITLDYARTRQAFGKTIGSFQSNRFTLAELRTEIDLAQVFVDQQILDLNAYALDSVNAAKAKWWCSELLKRVVDAGLQLHGGYGYMMDSPIARLYLDARVQTIYGGTTQIMKEIIGRSLGV